MCNVTVLRGRLSSDPRPLTLESGDLLVRYEVTVGRTGERTGERHEGPADSVPVVWIGAPGAAPPATLATGDEVVVTGRVRRRWYRAGPGGARSSTEVAADAVVPVRRRVTAARAVTAAVACAQAATSS